MTEPIYQTRPEGKYWLPKEFCTWPEIRSLSLAALGLFVEAGVWSNLYDNAPILHKSYLGRGGPNLYDALVAAGLWSPEQGKWGKAYRTKTMAELRSGRGRPGQIIRLDRNIGQDRACLTLRAMGLYALAASWSLNTPTPAFIPTAAALELGKRNVVGELWETGAWRCAEHGFEMTKGDGLRARWALARDDDRADIPPELRARIYDRDGHACLWCGATENLTLDHIMPWSLGGPDTEDNLQTLCNSCNSSKGARV